MVDKVYALSGSIITDNLDNIDKVSKALKHEENQILVVTGAGDLKKYIKSLDKLGNHGERDLLGIKTTRLNAKFLQISMNAYPKIPENTEEILEAAKTGENIVMGGLTPGHSTDAVAAIAAEILESKLYIASSIDGIYTGNPEITGSKKLKKAEPEKIRELIKGNSGAGEYELLDGTALDIIERSKIKTKLFKGTIENLKNPGQAEGTEIVTQ
ncbi:MAG: UMP kinase [Candidatus Nanohaloarchaea archaeon]